MLRDFLKPDLVIYNQDDPQAGALLLGASAAYPSEPVSGSGPLAQVRFRAESAGEASFGFANVTLADDQAAVFSARLENCELTILPAGEPTATRAPQAGSTEMPDSVATAVAAVVGSQAAGESEEDAESSTPEPAASPEPNENPPRGNFWLSALIGFAAVAGLAALAVLALWWRWRAGGG